MSNIIILLYMHTYIVIHQSHIVAISPGDTDKESVASDGSDSEDDFVVVIPDCFNLNLPLLSTPQQHLSQFHIATDYTCTSRDKTDDNDVMSQSHDSSEHPQGGNPPTVPSVTNPVPIPPPPQVSVPRKTEPEKQTPPTNTPPAGTSPRMGRRPFVPGRVTLREVKDGRLTNPLTVATGLVNTVTDLVEGLTLSGKKKETTEKDGGKQDEATTSNTDGDAVLKEQDEDEMFVVS